jgi:hypothetical protein
MKKALGDDLGAATPSQDARRLGAVLGHLGDMIVLSTLIERVRTLGRHVQAAKVRAKDERRQGGGQRGREQADGDDEEGDGHEHR